MQIDKNWAVSSLCSWSSAWCSWSRHLLHLFPQITISIQEYKWVTLDRQGGEGG